MKSERNLSLARFLVRVGDRLLFRPESEFNPGVSDEETERKRPLLRPYLLRVKTALSASAEESRILSVLRAAVRRVFTTRVRALSGAFFLSGVLQILSYFVGMSMSLGMGRVENLVFGTAFLLIALFGALVRGSVGEVLVSGRLYSSLLQPYFGVEKWQIPKTVERDPTLFLLLLGLAHGGLSLWLGASRACLLLLAFVLLLFLLFRPEAGLTLCAVFLFVMPKSWLAVTAVWTLLSYLLKCAVGKRSLVFSPMDAVLLVALCPLLFFSSGRGMEFLLLFSLYFSASGLLRNTASVKRLFRGFALGAFLWGGLLLVETLCGEFFPEATFLYPGLENVFFVEGSLTDGVLFAMLVPLLLGFGATAKGFSAKLFAFFALAFSVAAILLVQSGAVWLCMLAGVVIWLLFSYRYALLGFVMAGLGLISLLQLLPLSVARGFLSFFGVNPSLSVEGEALGLFSHAYQAFGVVGIVFFVILGGFFLYECYRFAGEGMATGMHPAVLSGLCAVLAFALSAFQPLPWDARSIALLMILLALPRAAARAAVREEVRLPY